MTFLLHTCRLKWTIAQNTVIIYTSVDDHVAYRLTPSILDETLRACVYLGEISPCPHRLAYVECSSSAEPDRAHCQNID